MRSGPSEPKQIRMRSAASYIGPESSSSLDIAGGRALTIANIHGRPCSPMSGSLVQKWCGYCVSELLAVNWLYGENFRVRYPIPELADPNNRHHGKL
jgi:hypothetical protein